MVELSSCEIVREGGETGACRDRAELWVAGQLCVSKENNALAVLECARVFVLTLPNGKTSKCLFGAANFCDSQMLQVLLTVTGCSVDIEEGEVRLEIADGISVCENKPLAEVVVVGQDRGDVASVVGGVKSKEYPFGETSCEVWGA